MGELHVDELLDILADSDAIYAIADYIVECIRGKGLNARRRGDRIIVPGVEDEDIADLADECLNKLAKNLRRNSK